MVAIASKCQASRPREISAESTGLANVRKRTRRKLKSMTKRNALSIPAPSEILRRMQACRTELIQLRRLYRLALTLERANAARQGRAGKGGHHAS